MTAGGTAGVVTAAAGSAAAQAGGNNTTGGGNASSGGNATGGNATGGNATGGNASGGNASAGGGGGGGGGSGPIDYGGWLDGANGWSEGSTVDARGKKKVTVQVGVGEGGLAFDPVAVHVDEGATIVWEWQSAGHNVAAQQGADFASDIQSSGTYEWKATGGPIVTYQCDPHAGQGMLGAIAIGDNVPRKSATAAAAEPADPEEMGVPLQPHFVGIATIMMMLSSLIFTFFLLKYGESPNTKGGN